MNIVLDAMGGDDPLSAVGALATVAAEFPDCSFVLVGKESVIRTLKEPGPQNVTLRVTDEVIMPDEEPVRAVRRKPEASLNIAAQMVKSQEAEVMLSAGSTGALVASGLLTIGRIPGIDRPALAPVLPTFDSQGVLLLDAGATMDASPHHLEQFAVMGTAYAKYVLGRDNPRVGLINVGTEAAKGNALTKEAYHLLDQGRFNFVGNVEARELLNGTVDIAICDGFVGNVVLKLIEGVGLGIFQELRTTFTATLWTKLAAGVLKPSLKGFRSKFDYAEYGGAPFLGVSGGCIKVHGSSNERAWIVAISQAVTFARQKLVQKITEDLHAGDASNGDGKGV